MYLVNANTERLEEVEILTVPGLFTTRRVDRATLPPWMHLYEMQTDPDDWSQPGLLGLHITVSTSAPCSPPAPSPCHPAAIWIWLPATSYRARVRSG